MCAAILSRGFHPGRTSSFAKQVVEVGNTVNWMDVAETLCENEQFGLETKFVLYDTYTNLKILFIQCYTGISEMAAVIYVSETIPLLDFCAISYNDTIDADEYINFCAHLRETGLYKEYVDKCHKIALSFGSGNNTGADITSPDGVANDYVYRMYSKSILQHLDEYINISDKKKIDDHEFGLSDMARRRAYKLTDEISHNIRVLKFVFEFRSKEEWAKALIDMEQRNEIVFLKRHGSQYLFDLADAEIDSNFQTHIRIVACWLQEGQVPGKAISLYKERYGVVLSNPTISNVTRVYKSCGLLGLRNLDRSLKSLKTGVSVYWQEFYYGMIELCKYQKYDIYERLNKLRVSHPDISSDIDAIIKSFDDMLNAVILTEASNN